MNDAQKLASRISCKKYYEANKVRLIKYNRAYNLAHREEILAKQRVRIVCECGDEMAAGSLYKHLTTRRHDDYVRGIRKRAY
jgi:hypothetical protein